MAAVSISFDCMDKTAALEKAKKKIEELANYHGLGRYQAAVIFLEALRYAHEHTRIVPMRPGEHAIERDYDISDFEGLPEFYLKD